MNTSENKKKPDILVIEDNIENLRLLEQLLENNGFRARLIPESDMAIAAAMDDLPDLILLDIMMPKIDGYEVCRQLKADAHTKDIPVIFISALNHIEGKVKAFSAGGVDYITKPFQKDEVLARISAHLHIRDLQKQLEEINQTLELRVMEKTSELMRMYAKMDEINRQLQQSQKMEAIGTLAGGIAHDFNNILFGMFGYLELIINRLPKNGIVREWAEEVFQFAKRADELVTQILTFSKQTDVSLKPLKVQYIVKEVLKLIRSTLPSTITIQHDINTTCGYVMANPTQIHQIVMNLITNAFHAMEQNGGILEIKVIPLHSESDDVRVYNMPPGDYICFSVKDTGIGMTQYELERMYNPYFTTKGPGKGTGLGLAVVHGIVKNCGGSIRVESEPDKGTIFRVLFRQVEEPAVTCEPNAVENPQKGGNERLLVVDDEEKLAVMMQHMLHELGYDVTIRTDSASALDIFRMNPGYFDLVITDMTMPGMTGIRLAQKMMEIRPDIPVILCSGFSEQLSEEAAKILGIREVIKKPVQQNELASIICRVISDNL